VSAKAQAPVAVRTAVVFTHTQADQTSAALREAIAAAERAGARLIVPAEEAAKHGGEVAGAEVRDELPERPDLCLVLGGDGTILQALRHYAGTGVPVFGINFGTIGFLAAVERTELEEGLRRAFSGDFELMSLPGLQAEVETEIPIALNDVSFIRRPHGRVAELSYRLGGEEVGHVRCDGLVAATPAGSTGYNLANQGPILAWGVKGYVVSFIAPHTLTARALVVAPDDVLYVANQAGRDAVDVVLDGEHVGELASGAEMAVHFRDAMGSLAQLPGANFYRRIREKFGRLAKQAR
jgi:NAD+ kinase